jgi:hypothetical protein
MEPGLLNNSVFRYQNPSLYQWTISNLNQGKVFLSIRQTFRKSNQLLPCVSNGNTVVLLLLIPFLGESCARLVTDPNLVFEVLRTSLGTDFEPFLLECTLKAL